MPCGIGWIEPDRRQGVKVGIAITPLVREGHFEEPDDELGRRLSALLGEDDNAIGEGK